MAFVNSLDIDQDEQNVSPYLDRGNVGPDSDLNH